MISITAGVRCVERLKCAVLTSVSTLFELLQKRNYGTDREECISDLILNAYLLAAKLGIEPSTINAQIFNKLRAGILNEDELKEEMSMLIQQINRGEGNE